MADVEIDLEITNPQELVGLGIRAYAMGDFCNAAAAFGRATQLLALQHGDEHDSLGEIYIHYAKALLEVSREEAEPLGDAIPHGDSESESEEEVEGENGTDKPETSTEKEETNEKDKEEPVKNGSEENKSEDPIYEENKSEEPTNEENKSEEPTNEENCSDLQIAWEVLEVAKKIFTNRGDSGKELLAETLILLGEVAMESENFSDGVNDMKAGLEMQKSLFEPFSRKLAETYYKVGIAHSTMSNIEEAVNCFNSSIDILKKRIAILKESKDEKTENIKNDEIEEITTLIPEIEEKISDTKSIKEEMATQLIKGMAEKTEKAKEDGASSSKATDISHLVKRKRKPDEDSSEIEVLPAKRPTP